MAGLDAGGVGRSGAHRMKAAGRIERPVNQGDSDADRAPATKAVPPRAFRAKALRNRIEMKKVAASSTIRPIQALGVVRGRKRARTVPAAPPEHFTGSSRSPESDQRLIPPATRGTGPYAGSSVGTSVAYAAEPPQDH